MGRRGIPVARLDRRRHARKDRQHRGDLRRGKQCRPNQSSSASTSHTAASHAKIDRQQSPSWHRESPPPSNPTAIADEIAAHNRSEPSANSACPRRNQRAPPPRATSTSHAPTAPSRAAVPAPASRSSDTRCACHNVGEQQHGSDPHRRRPIDEPGRRQRRNRVNAERPNDVLRIAGPSESEPYHERQTRRRSHRRDDCIHQRRRRAGRRAAAIPPPRQTRRPAAPASGRSSPTRAPGSAARNSSSVQPMSPAHASKSKSATSPRPPSRPASGPPECRTKRRRS